MLVKNNLEKMLTLLRKYAHFLLLNLEIIVAFNMQLSVQCFNKYYELKKNIFLVQSSLT